jgi:hypothetical protein
MYIQKEIRKKLRFFGILKVTEEKRRIRIRWSEVRIRWLGSGFVTDPEHYFS